MTEEGGGVLWLCGMGSRTGDDEESGKLEFCHDAGCSEVWWFGVGSRVWQGARDEGERAGVFICAFRDSW